MEDWEADLLALAQDALVEQGLETALADEAVNAARGVMESDLWKRASAAEQVLVEVPFEILMADAGSAGESPGLLVRGAIDLAFHEPQGWVIVDYKTDRRPADRLEGLVEKYRAQVQLYARAWTTITGQPVHEAGLYFTHSRTYRKIAW